MSHSALPPSPWVQRWSHLVRAGGTVLDVACGSGRHLRWFAGGGWRVTGVDRDAEALAPLAPLAAAVVADIENGPWPFTGRRFDAVVVTNGDPLEIVTQIRHLFIGGEEIPLDTHQTILYEKFRRRP